MAKSTRKGTRDTVHIALLRGINVGGKNRLGMAALVAAFEETGAVDVRTYIQSGNVVYRANKAVARELPKSIATNLRDRHGLDIPLVTRTAPEWRTVIETNPYIDEGADPKTLHVAFLSTKPTAAKVAALDPDRSPPDTFIVHGCEIYLHCPNGLARTKLTNAYLDRVLATVTTVRNWNPVLKLMALAESL